MSDQTPDRPADTPQSQADTEQPPLERPEIVTEDRGADEQQTEAVEAPAKVMRVGSMVRQLLEEVRDTDLDEPSRERVREMYDTAVRELSTALSPDLSAELERLAPSLSESSTPTDAELRLLHAQLVGWLEGLFHGIQATLFAQQITTRRQLEDIRGRLPEGDAGERPGTYL